jgi:calcineurin-like phosphoesterase family protein
MANIWVISDTHFGHENFLKFMHKGHKVRDFADAKQMDEFMIEQWNSVVMPGDKVYHLGDVYFGSEENAQYCLSALRGKKRLILGNHDMGKSKVLHQHFEKINMWRVWKNERILFSHVPCHPSNLTIGISEDKFPNWEDRPKAFFMNVHGHIHSNPSPEGPYFNACVEWHNYKPIHMDVLVDAAKKFQG